MKNNCKGPGIPAHIKSAAPAALRAGRHKKFPDCITTPSHTPDGTDPLQDFHFTNEGYHERE
ncbi:hypothetical protein CBFG_01492 [Clostridiales bacterium 1_7_47FAA]|nr:hypothetical protein CBFG_01492 [Clostridiales bacterium 1_7_47FAA]